MDRAARLICAGSALVDGGPGVRFEVGGGESPAAPAFAIRYAGRVCAYLNRCAHIGVQLDWLPGRFFDDSGIYLICAMHGALYAPDSGHCVGGPCRNAGLVPLGVIEREGGVYLGSE